eukprot:TRINITY_DN4355_c0_g1_i4.p1 TRINITY_DN4355_c0_g1~~TRINITY_DN4355_c0_g1_i4.p1  ORF type:complete len:886 (+),score=54.55 TRINITY_DN4355_c0_g1_i4:477-3134(+)
MNLPDDVLGHIFTFLDGKGYRNTCLTCIKWNELANTVQVWSEIGKLKIFGDSHHKSVRQFRAGVSERANAWLPQNKELERLGKSSDIVRFDTLSTLKRVYRVLSTAFVVPGNLENENSLNEMKNDILEGTKHHTILRNNRVFAKVSEAIEAASEGDFIFLHKGRFEVELNIDKNVHIFGTIGIKMDKDEPVYLLLTTLQGPITWENLKGKSSLTSCYFPSASKLSINNSKVHLMRLVLGGDSHVIVGDNGDVKIWRCNFDRCRKPITVSPSYKNLDVYDSFFDNNYFEPPVLSTIIKKFQSNLESNEIMIGCMHTLGVVSKMKKSSLNEIILNTDVIGTFYYILKNKKNPKLLFTLLQSINKFLISDDIGFINELSKINFVPYLRDMIDRFPLHKELQEWIPICLWNLLNQASARHYFKEPDLIFHLVSNLEKNINEHDIVYEIISFFWHSAHHMPTLRNILIQCLPRIVKCLDNHKKSERLHKEVMGLIWNLPGVWPSGVAKDVLVHILHAFSLASNYSSVNTTLGGFLIVTRRCPKREIEFLMDSRIVKLLLELKMNTYVEGEAENRLWKALTLIGSINAAQKCLTDLVSRDLKHPPLTEMDRIKIIRSLTIHDTIDTRVFDLLSQMISKTTDSKVYFYAMDAVAHLHMNEHMVSYSDEIKKISKILKDNLHKFKSDRKVNEWIGWALLYIDGLPRTVPFGMDPVRSAMVHISSDGTVCRHEFSGAFGTAIASRPVTSGKWYYELEPLTQGLFQTGWVNDKFKPQPEEGIGVGDDKNGWGIDLKKHTKWHLNDDGTVRVPYAKGVVIEVGGVIQCYLDLDAKVMSFGYNGKHQGEAFTDFDIGQGLYAAVSTNLENECKLNFGETPFKYPQTEYKGLFFCVKN